MNIKVLGIAVAALALTGCSTPVYDGRFAWADGWREGTVASVRALDPAKGSLADCRPSSTGLQGDVDMVTVRYTRMSRATWWTGAVSRAQEARVGDALYFNLKDCRIALRPPLASG